MKKKFIKIMTIVMAFSLVASFLPTKLVKADVGDQYQAIAVTGFNSDMVANGSGLPSATTDNTFDDDPCYSVFYVKGYEAGTKGLPVDGVINSNYLAGATYKLADYNSKNALILNLSQSATLTFVTSGSYKSLSILSASANGGSSFNATVNFSDNTNTTYSFSVPDWCNSSAGFSITDIGRLNSQANTFEDNIGDGLFDDLINLNSDDQKKLVKSITFTKYGSSDPRNKTGIFAVCGVVNSGAPSVPAVSAATSVTATSFTANWNSISGATDYRLDVATDPNFDNMVSGYNNFAVTGNSKTVSGLTPNTTYYYRVRGNNDSGQSFSSSSSTATTLAAPVAPAAPTNPVQNDAGNTFGWTNVAGYSNASDYEYSLDGGLTWTTVSSNPQTIPDQNYATGAVQVRVKADSTNGRPAGAALSSTAAYTVTPSAPTAPTNPVQNDAGNTFGWTNVAGYSNASDYEYSLDVGLTWTTVSSNPQTIPDNAYVAGAVQVRVKADSTNGRPAGAALSSTAAYTVTPSAPTAPTNPVQNDAENTFGWTNVAGYNNASDYEYSLDGGLTWTTVNSNPQTIPDNAYAAGAVQVRVKADSTNGRPAGAVLSSTAAYTVTPSAPTAPTNPVQNDAENTFGWTNVAGYNNASDYEYSLDGGLTWTTVNSNPQTIPDNAYAAGAVQVRVKADSTNGRPAGAALSSTAAYTVTPSAPTAPTNPVQNDAGNTFGWTNVAGYNNASDYEYSLDGGLTWTTVSSNPQTIPDQNYAAGAVQVRVKADSTNGRPAGAVLSSTAAYTITPTAVNGTLIDGNSNKQISNISATVTTDINGNKVVSIDAAQAVAVKQTDGSVSQFGDLSKVIVSSSDGSSIAVSDDGKIKLDNVPNGTDESFDITYDLGNGQKIVIGKLQVKVSNSGEVTLESTLIDPYGIITDSVTGKALSGVNLTLYYADTARNRAAGKIPGTIVQLPEIVGFNPNNNHNPQVSDVLGEYGFMVFPNTDYYVVATKDGYTKYTSPTISVEKDIVKFDITMTAVTAVTTTAATAAISLPKTGSPIDMEVFMVIGIMLMAAGAVVLSKGFSLKRD